MSNAQPVRPPAPGNDAARSAPAAPRGALGGRHRLGLVAAAATLLASAPLAAIFDGWTWLFHCTVAVAAVAVAAAAARALRMPVWAQVLVMLGGLLIILTWMFPSGEELLGILPTAATLEHFGVLFNELPGEVRERALPVPGLDPFLLVTVLGVGLVAILVDLCTVGLRRPALAGLPMLAVYSVPVAVKFNSVPAITFAIGVVGYLWLLGTDNVDRVRRFGRRFTGDGRDVDLWEPSPLAAAGRRLAVIGVLVAVALPLAVPGVNSGLVDRFGSGFAGFGGTGSGGSPSAVNLFAALDGLLNRDETVDMLRVATSDPDPHYLRIGVADQITAAGFDHRRPRGAPVAAGLTGPTTTAGITPHENLAEVEILSGFTMPRLPTYPELVEIEGLDASWRHDEDQQVIFSSEDSAAGQNYRFAYARPEYDPEALRRVSPLPRQHDLQALASIPGNIHEPEVTALVEDLTGGLDNQYDQVRAILEHFSSRNGFRYSLETGNATTGSAIVDFLIHNQQGYCVQYAAAMAWMVREIGMPSRVAIGFTSGRSRTEGSYTLTNHNAHAWTEVYFEGFGWVPFDPTPRASVGGAVATDWAPDPDAPDSSDPGDSQTDANSPVPQPTAPDPNDPRYDDEGAIIGGPIPTDEARSPLLWWVLGALALALALLATPALSRIRLRRARLRRRAAASPAPGGAAVPASPTGAAAGVVTGLAGDPSARRRAHAAWAELLDTMTDFQVLLDPAETPRVTAARLVKECRLDPGPSAEPTRAGDGARLLGHAEERARYARTALPPDGLWDALRAVRRSLRGQSTRRTRLRAALLPPSTLRRWRQSIGDAVTGAASTMNRGAEWLARLSPRRLIRSS